MLRVYLNFDFTLTINGLNPKSQRLCAQVYEGVVDTLLLCFCDDCERHDGHPQYAPRLLLAAVGHSHPSRGIAAASSSAAPEASIDSNGGKGAAEHPAVRVKAYPLVMVMPPVQTTQRRL